MDVDCALFVTTPQLQFSEDEQRLLKELRQNIITQAVTRGINPDAPLKDSGVEWIGEVPEHWDIKRIKHCTQIFGRIGFRGYTEKDIIDCLCMNKNGKEEKIFLKKR